MTQLRQQRYAVTRLDTPEDFINALRQARGLRSDYQVAALLDISHQAVSRYRHGKAGFDAETSKKVADFLGLDHEFVMSRMQAFRAPTDDERAAWRRASDTIRAAMKDAGKKGFKLLVGAAIGAASSGGFNNKTIASPSPSPAEQRATAGGNTHCATNRRRRRLAGWCSWFGLARLAGAL